MADAGPKAVIGAIDGWQQRHRVPATAYGVVKKFGDDKLGMYVVVLGWYGFTAIYLLLLAIVAVLGFVGVGNLGHGLVSELHKFPVIGAQFTPGSGGARLHGTVFGLVFGLAGLVYGALGVTKSVEAMMGRVWNVPELERPKFVAQLAHSAAGLVPIGLAFLVTAAASGYATGSHHAMVIRVLVTAALLVVNIAFYLVAWRLLTPHDVSTGDLLVGAVVGAVAFTALTTVGTGLVSHQIQHMSATYGALASVVGVVAYLLLLARASAYAAEVNPVLHRHLYPRALPTRPPTDADDQVIHDLAHEQRRRPDQKVGVGFGESSPEEARIDASGDDDHARQPDLDSPRR